MALLNSLNTRPAQQLNLAEGNPRNTNSDLFSTAAISSLYQNNAFSIKDAVGVKKEEKKQEIPASNTTNDASALSVTGDSIASEIPQDFSSGTPTTAASGEIVSTNGSGLIKLGFGLSGYKSVVKKASASTSASSPQMGVSQWLNDDEIKWLLTIFHNYENGQQRMGPKC